ncbi:signal peptidase II [Rhizobium sp. 9140]|uniref:signal peptidase II n=1 Tax=Rhizobium sp. 9140 TaxID=1761900 RepID=UPI000B81D134|nr:signal peptidase II [Rhizobium sp. 9140]
MTRFKQLTVAFLAGLCVLATDQVVKLVVVEFVMQPPREIPVLPFLNLILAFNRGVSFGMFADQLADIPGILGGVKILIVLGLLIWAFLSKTAAEAVSLGLIAGGAAGNIVDRLRDGAVTDFIDMYAGSWHWPAFNFADVAIFCGAVLLVLSTRSSKTATPSR